MKSCSLNSHICCSKENNIANLIPKKCGIRNQDGIGYDLANKVEEAEFGEFPWMAALSERKTSEDYKYFCGGSLIEPRVILTGAHCVYEKRAEDIRVTLGEWDPQTDLEILPHENHEVSQVILHPDFGLKNLYNDVALLILKSPAKLSVHINTICLPPQNYRVENLTCFASGWGSENFGVEEVYRANLKKIELPIVPLRECQASLRATTLGPRFKIHNSFMCAGGEEATDTCTGETRNSNHI